MQEYDLAVVGILWGTAVTFALAAVTMVDSGRKKLLACLWAVAVVFLVAAIAWPSVAEKWPALKAAAENAAANKIAINLLGTAIFCLLVLDFWLRSRWLSKAGNIRGAGRADSSEFAALDAALQGLFERVGSIESLPAPATAEDHNNLKTTFINSMRDQAALEGKITALLDEVNNRLDNLEKSTATPAANPQMSRDLLLLMHFVVYQSTLLMLDDLLNAAPKDMSIGPLQLGGDFVLKNALAKEFVELVRRKLDHNSLRRSEFESVMYNAEVTSERRLEETPVDERPNGVDAFALRRWVIAHMQCVCAIEFLEEQKREAARNLLNQRSNLLQQYRLRNPS